MMNNRGQQNDMSSTPFSSSRGMASGNRFNNDNNRFGNGIGMGMGGGRINQKLNNGYGGRASAMSSRNVPPQSNFGGTNNPGIGPEMYQPSIGPDKNFMQNMIQGGMSAMRNQDNRTVPNNSNIMNDQTSQQNMGGTLGGLIGGMFGGNRPGGIGPTNMGIWNPWAKMGMQEPQFYQDMINRGARF